MLRLSRAMPELPLVLKPKLTPRERDVARRLVSGRTNREIAVELRLSEQTVKNTVSAVFAKCDVRNRVEFVVYALHHQLITK